MTIVFTMKAPRHTPHCAVVATESVETALFCNTSVTTIFSLLGVVKATKSHIQMFHGSTFMYEIHTHTYSFN